MAGGRWWRQVAGWLEVVAGGRWLERWRQVAGGSWLEAGGCGEVAGGRWWEVDGWSGGWRWWLEGGGMRMVVWLAWLVGWWAGMAGPVGIRYGVSLPNRTETRQYWQYIYR